MNRPLGYSKILQWILFSALCTILQCGDKTSDEKWQHKI